MPSSDCQKNIYWERCLFSPSHPQNDLCLPRACPRYLHTVQNSCWKWVCITGPLGARSRDWRPSRAGPFSHGQLLRSRRVSKGKTWTWDDPIKQSPQWVHLQATAHPLTPKFSCTSIFFFLRHVFPTRPIYFPEKYQCLYPPHGPLYTTSCLSSPFFSPSTITPSAFSFQESFS